MNRKNLSDEHLRKFLGKRIKKAREMKNLTQPQLAELIHSTDRNISNYETGYSFPSTKVLYNISLQLDVSVDFLFGFTNNPMIHREKNEGRLEEDDYRILQTIKEEGNLYQFIKENPPKNLSLINEIWTLLNEFHKD